MLNRIVSGGQTGVDRAALDAALDRGIPCGGWCPRGRRAEDGVIPARYPLRETASSRYIDRTRRNVCDADATLVLTYGKPSGGTAATVGLAQQTKKPLLIVDMAEHDVGEAAARIIAWLAQGPYPVLNVAGPRGDKEGVVYAAALRVLDAVLREIIQRDPTAPA